MILALDTSTAACTVALIGEDGACLASADELIGRGHAERLAPMIHDLLAGRRPDAILVGCGPGSFTGLRVGIAAAHGMAIGWDVPLAGMGSLALLAAGAPGDDAVAAAMQGGHGELFVQQFARRPLQATSEILSLPPIKAALVVSAGLVVGPGAEALVEARRGGRALPSYPRAADAARLPAGFTGLQPRPIYARAPDAKPPATRLAEPA